MIRDEVSYDDLTIEELGIELNCLDKEIEDCQAYLAKLRRSLKQKEDLRESLIEIVSRRRNVKGWPKNNKGN